MNYDQSKIDEIGKRHHKQQPYMDCEPGLPQAFWDSMFFHAHQDRAYLLEVVKEQQAKLKAIGEKVDIANGYNVPDDFCLLTEIEAILNQGSVL